MSERVKTNNYNTILHETTMAIVAAAGGKLRLEDVREDASLSLDLAMSSLVLTDLIVELGKRFGKIRLTGWYVQATEQGKDTVGGLAAYIDNALMNASQAAR